MQAVAAESRLGAPPCLRVFVVYLSSAGFAVSALKRRRGPSDHEYPRRQRVPRRRFGGAGARRPARRRRRGGALPAHQALRRRAAARDAGLSGNGRPDAGRHRCLRRVARPAGASLAQGVVSAPASAARNGLGARPQHGRRSRAARRARRRARPRPRAGPVAHPLRRASSRAPGERRLRRAVRGGGRLRHRRVRRFRQHVMGTRGRTAALG